MTKPSKGRTGKLISNLKTEISEINEQQKMLSKRLKRINLLIQKL
jgi:hypothetical protein